MNKKIIFFILLILIVGIYFLWEWKKESEMGFVPFTEFKERVFEGNRTIEHGSTGFSAKVPLNWQIYEGIGGNRFFLVRPDENCSIEISIRREKKDSIFDIEYSYISEQIQSFPDQIVNIDGNKAFRKYFSLVSQGECLSVKVLKKENVYSFKAFLGFSEQEKCNEEFEHFLETVSIL